MAPKKIKMKIEHAIEVANVDVDFEVRDGSDLLGRLEISKGGIDWYPRSAQSPRRSTWAQFDAWMKTDDPPKRRGRAPKASA